MIVSEKCFVCNGKIASFSNLYLIKRSSCDGGCTTTHEKEGVVTLFLHLDKVLIKEINHPMDKFRYEFKFFQPDSLDEFIFELDGNDVPIFENTYDLSEYLFNFIPQINKMKAFA